MLLEGSDDIGVRDSCLSAMSASSGVVEAMPYNSPLATPSPTVNTLMATGIQDEQKSRGPHASVDSLSLSDRQQGTAPDIRHRPDPSARARSMQTVENIELKSIRDDTAATSTAVRADVETGSGSQSRVPSIRSIANHEAAAESGPDAQQRRKGLIHFLALCFCLFVNGWNDGTTGPMLPRVQEKYNVCMVSAPDPFH